MADPATILLVDDEESVQKLLTYPLERDGFRVVQARDGDEAMSRFDGESIDLVVLATPCPGSSQGFISPDLSGTPSVVKSGYTIALADSTVGTPADVTDDCNTTKSRTGYYATAVPVGVGNTGVRGFSTAAHGTLYFVADATGGAPPEVGGTPLQ